MFTHATTTRSRGTALVTRAAFRPGLLSSLRLVEQAGTEPKVLATDVCDARRLTSELSDLTNRPCDLTVARTQAATVTSSGTTRTAVIRTAATCTATATGVAVRPMFMGNPRGNPMNSISAIWYAKTPFAGVKHVHHRLKKRSLV